MLADVLSPMVYRHWRASPLGAATEALERALVFRLAGQLSGRRVLDVGCGDGTYALAAAQRGARVVGVDCSPAMIEAARQRTTEADLSVQFQVADMAALPFKDNHFDVVIAVTVLCFVQDAPGALLEVVRVLAPGGRLVPGGIGPLECLGRPALAARSPWLGALASRDLPHFGRIACADARSRA